MDLTLWQYQFRIIMLGDSTVGKSSMLKRYTEDQFMECINETVGVDFYVHFLEVEPGMMIKLQFWDTAGQERFRYNKLTIKVLILWQILLSRLLFMNDFRFLSSYLYLDLVGMLILLF